MIVGEEAEDTGVVLWAVAEAVWCREMVNDQSIVGGESCSLVTGGGAWRQLIMGWLLGLVEGKGHF